jgi:hypothetical protein
MEPSATAAGKNNDGSPEVVPLQKTDINSILASLQGAQHQTSPAPAEEWALGRIGLMKGSSAPSATFLLPGLMNAT